MVRPGAGHAAAFDPYLAALVAYATMASLAGRPYWRNALWVAIAGYAIVHVATWHTSILSLLITVIGGRATGLAVRYFAGSASQRPGARAIAAALTAAGVPGAAAASAVLLFRLLTFWLPVPFGFGALKYLEREQAL